MECVIGLGANLGDRWLTLDWAVSAVRRLGEVTGLSLVYETDPVGGPPQPRYLNAAVGLRTRLGPLELLAQLLRVERAAGRERRVRWGPRTLDLDILWIRGITVRTPDLEVPHPRLLVRPFALVPLLEVAPGALDPRTGAAYAEALEVLSREGMKRLARPLSPRATIG
jgi:2-amino-4-hydroxy-6-hydroxymethyldihydropteridine diphosphokinase